MVIALVILTVILFIIGDLIYRRGDKVLKKVEGGVKKPIFLSPEKVLQPIENLLSRLYHPSHSWVLANGNGHSYIGYDDFISYLFPAKVRISTLASVGPPISQGDKLWNLGSSDEHSITQLSPISGEVLEVNPAINSDVPLSSKQIEKSWIMKIKPTNYSKEVNNLINHANNSLIVSLLKQKLTRMFQKDNVINDGGKLVSSFINFLSEEEWQNLIGEFFPYQKCN